MVENGNREVFYIKITVFLSQLCSLSFRFLGKSLFIQPPGVGFGQNICGWVNHKYCNKFSKPGLIKENLI